MSRAPIKRILWSFAIGVVVTLGMIWLSFAADDAGHQTLSDALYWQNWVLQSLLPTPDIGTLEHPFREGIPLTFVAWFASIPLGVLVYGLAAFFLSRGLTKSMK
ncbi:MAG: hypothetical protein ABWX83_15265 [Luteibacter sp.]